MSEHDKKILVSDLSYDDDEVEAVVSVLRSEWLTMGPKTAEFEGELAKYLGVKHVVAVSNGTAALHVGLLSLGIGPGDEVIVTPMSFVASSNAVLYTGAKSVFVDIDSDTFNIDPQLIEAAITPRTKAILPVHVAGLPAEMNEITRIAKDHDLLVLDDAAHAIGAQYRNRKVGSLADMTAFSFFSNKNLSVGEGGAIATNSDTYAEKARLLRSHGLTKSTWSRHHDGAQESFDQLYDMVELGYNYRMTEMAAALGLVQLRKLDTFNKRRTEVYALYKENAQDLPLTMQSIPKYVKHTHHVLPVLVPDGRRADLRARLQEEEIGTSIHYTPIHRFSYYRRIGYGSTILPKAEEVGKRVVTLPLHQKMTDADVGRVIRALRHWLH